MADTTGSKRKTATRKEATPEDQEINAAERSVNAARQRVTTNLNRHPELKPFFVPGTRKSLPYTLEPDETIANDEKAAKAYAKLKEDVSDLAAKRETLSKLKEERKAAATHTPNDSVTAAEKVPAKPNAGTDANQKESTTEATSASDDAQQKASAGKGDKVPKSTKQDARHDTAKTPTANGTHDAKTKETPASKPSKAQDIKAKETPTDKPSKASDAKTKEMPDAKTKATPADKPSKAHDKADDAKPASSKQPAQGKAKSDSKPERRELAKTEPKTLTKTNTDEPRAIAKPKPATTAATEQNATSGTTEAATKRTTVTESGKKKAPSKQPRGNADTKGTKRDEDEPAKTADVPHDDTKQAGVKGSSTPKHDKAEGGAKSSAASEPAATKPKKQEEKQDVIMDAGRHDDVARNDVVAEVTHATEEADRRVTGTEGNHADDNSTPAKEDKKPADGKQAAPAGMESAQHEDGKQGDEAHATVTPANDDAVTAGVREDRDVPTVAPGADEQPYDVNEAEPERMTCHDDSQAASFDTAPDEVIDRIGTLDEDALHDMPVYAHRSKAQWQHDGIIGHARVRTSTEAGVRASKTQDDCEGLFCRIGKAFRGLFRR